MMIFPLIFMKLYTGRGDKGETDILEGGRVKKSSLRVEVYGTVDELNSVLGIARLYIGDKQINRLLFQIQEKLFILGSDLAAIKGENVPRISEEDIKWVEKVIDEILSELKTIDRFVFPGGSLASAHLHFGRAVCRRMERRIQALSIIEPVNENAYIFSNRLSSLLFGLSLLVNQRLGVEEVKWMT
jgi:cob(I)alamin adenosyltransferase